MKSDPKNEEAFSIVEIMIAAIVIMIVLLSTAVGLTSAFRSSATIENHNKAVQLANEVVAISKQSSYRKLYTELQDVSATIDPDNPGKNLLFDPPVGKREGKCVPQNQIAPAGSIPPNTLRVSTGEDGTPFSGLVYCAKKQFGPAGKKIGTSFYVQTQIVYLTTAQASDDNASTSPAIRSTGTGNYYAKRVYVTVRWQDVASGTDSDGDPKWNEYITSYTKTPSPSDCIPDTVTSTSLTGCDPTP